MSYSNILKCTPRALKYVREKLSKRTLGDGLRLGIKKSGCSGWLYTFNYGKKVDENEIACILSEDVTVFIQKKFSSVFQGACLDYMKSGLNGYLTCINPNVIGQCGCGESFSLNSLEIDKQ